MIDLKVEMVNDPSFKDGVSYNLYQRPEITVSIGSYAEELVGGKWRMHDLRKVEPTTRIGTDFTLKI